MPEQPRSERKTQNRVIALFTDPVQPAVDVKVVVAKVDRLMALVDQLEAQLAESQATATKLLEAVVAELTA